MTKKQRGNRPVTFGNLFRSSMAKVGLHTVSRTMLYESSTIQLGISVKGGAEVAVHAVCKSISNKIDLDD